MLFSGGPLRWLGIILVDLRKKGWKGRKHTGFELNQGFVRPSGPGLALSLSLSVSSVWDCGLAEQ